MILAVVVVSQPGMQRHHDNRKGRRYAVRQGIPRSNGGRGR
jgi:hypothetical protein